MRTTLRTLTLQSTQHITTLDYMAHFNQTLTLTKLSSNKLSPHCECDACDTTFFRADLSYNRGD